MKVSINWLKRYVVIEEDALTLAKDLTMFGLNVEEVIEQQPRFKGVVFGKVLEVSRHPSADKLSVCKVEAGGPEPLNIICGAPNVAEGQSVPVAIHGASLPGGLKIKRSKIRGIVSEGMICSEVELGIGDDSSGIMVLDFETKPGTPLEEVLGSKDTILDIEVTPNRPDQLSHFGVAREIAAMYKRGLKLPETISLDDLSDFDLAIDDKDDCPRYTAAFIDNVNIAPSPKWMQELLISVGMKPINNIVDITNFILMELGQPLHAFDRDRLEGDKIRVRRAEKGEKIVTLDEVERELDEEILVIADASKPVAIAGVMGGIDTEVTGSTKRVLLESALFERRLIRRARKKFRLETEASYRFEREGDIGITKFALERAAYLVREMQAGECDSRCRDLITSKESLKERKVPLRVKQVNRLMGTHLDANDIAEILGRLEFKAEPSKLKVDVLVPSFRRDIDAEVDLIEEVARVYGYENIGKDEEKRTNIFSKRNQDERRNEAICDFLTMRGFAEVVTSSFVDSNDLEKLGWSSDDRRMNALRISNPLTEAQSLLRTSLLPGLVNVAKRNLSAEAEGLKIFEMGKVFIKKDVEDGLPDEELHLTALMSGNSAPLQWFEKPRKFDIYDLKGEIESLFKFIGMNEDITMQTHTERPGILRYLMDGNGIVEAGIMHRSVLKRFDLEEDILFFDMCLDELPKAAISTKKFSQIIQYPSVKRDLCLVVDEGVYFEDIKRIIVQEAKHLDSITPFDYYHDGNLGEGKKSYTVRLTFRSEKGTLESERVDAIIEKLLEELRNRLHVKLRS